MKKQIITLCLTALLSFTSLTSIVFAESHPNISTDLPNYYELKTDDEPIAEFWGDSSTNIEPRASYTVTADKDIYQNPNNSNQFRTKGWVNIVDKKSNTGLRHSTTAVVADYYDPDSYKGAVTETGQGKVWATSEWVDGWCWPRIFWDWID